MLDLLHQNLCKQTRGLNIFSLTLSSASLNKIVFNNFQRLKYIFCFSTFLTVFTSFLATAVGTSFFFLGISRVYIRKKLRFHINLDKKSLLIVYKHFHRGEINRVQFSVVTSSFRGEFNHLSNKNSAIVLIKRIQ